MINADEILGNLGSLVVIKQGNKVVYINSKETEGYDVNRRHGKKVIARDGKEYEIIVYPPVNEQHFDNLTGLLSKETFKYELEEYYEYAFNNDEDFCLAFMDLDNFKLINDTYGHLTADKVLTMIGHIIKENTRCTDKCSRFGGDEFLLLIKANREETLRIIKKIEQTIEAINSCINNNGENILIGASSGIISSKDADSLEELLELADRALYEAKKNKGSIVSYDGDYHTKYSAR